MAKFNLICKSGKCEGHDFVSYQEIMEIIEQNQFDEDELELNKIHPDWNYALIILKEQLKNLKR